ncbi:threonine-phosphate decarboxylase CobD [Phaeovulum vinaykumarii]|uniref:threonine-phosphate decarboxylase n=1 Tax=Phaeovulum vinaykumarii TaxID=407234 RepID=A0A1N7KC64_9RHOB|nr:threonine-phosphate decarboxylase CobD [Phaeovulum vinaykumarii]SIS59181.1 L-threonine O-3-phosphate decarboxylase [Phaeovulum vinaykumarii]SOB94034.1 L-threonine O-3-phosphate decarboxylase [Phaeovulum vinaykumarii]
MTDTTLPPRRPREHGGNLDAARSRFGGEDWIDLSTGINRQPYPLPPLSPAAWTDLPTRAAQERLTAVAASAFATPAAILALNGAQGAIQLIPRVGRPGRARVLGPTYNEHAGALRAAGWAVTEVATLDALAGADLAVVVNPNNPDGQSHDPQALLRLSRQVGRLVVDESFADPVPGLSLAPQAGVRGLFVLRSFGKFWGLAGVRLGFVLGHPDDIAALSDLAGPWPVSGAAIEIGCAALADRAWTAASTARLVAETARLDALAAGAGWTLVGGTALFRTYQTGDGLAAQERLARARIWTRAFSARPGWLRLGLPGTETEWTRLAAALEGTD